MESFNGVYLNEEDLEECLVNKYNLMSTSYFQNNYLLINEKLISLQEFIFFSKQQIYYQYTKDILNDDEKKQISQNLSNFSPITYSTLFSNDVFSCELISLKDEHNIDKLSQVNDKYDISNIKKQNVIAEYVKTYNEIKYYIKTTCLIIKEEINKFQEEYDYLTSFEKFCKFYFKNPHNNSDNNSDNNIDNNIDNKRANINVNIDNNIDNKRDNNKNNNNNLLNGFINDFYLFKKFKCNLLKGKETLSNYFNEYCNSLLLEKYLEKKDLLQDNISKLSHTFSFIFNIFISSILYVNKLFKKCIFLKVIQNQALTLNDSLFITNDSLKCVSLLKKYQKLLSFHYKIYASIIYFLKSLNVDHCKEIEKKDSSNKIFHHVFSNEYSSFILSNSCLFHDIEKSQNLDYYLFQVKEYTLKKNYFEKIFIKN